MKLLTSKCCKKPIHIIDISEEQDTSGNISICTTCGKHCNVKGDCPNCDGEGYTAEHDQMCNGSCEYCPVQVQCNICNGIGSITNKSN